MVVNLLHILIRLARLSKTVNSLKHVVGLDYGFLVLVKTGFRLLVSLGLGQNQAKTIQGFSRLCSDSTSLVSIWLTHMKT